MTDAERRDPTKEAPAPAAPGIADPAPIGLAGFALTTFVLSVVNAGFVPEEVAKVFVPLAFFYGGLAQLLAGMWEIRNKNTFGATAFTSYGAFWIALGFLDYFAPSLGMTDETRGTMLGLTLLSWSIITAILWLASWGLNTALGVVFTLLLATFVILTIAEFTGNKSIAHLGGYVGIATAAAAWYVAAAIIINDTYGRAILPVGPAAGGGS